MAEHPRYVVGRVIRADDVIERIDVLALDVQAANQEKACDKLAEGLDGPHELGAFLASSLKTFDYAPETVTKLNKTPRHGAALRRRKASA